MNADLLDAVKYCEQNNATLLSHIVPSVISASSVVPQYRYKNLNRSKVPLLSICTAAKAIDCARILILNGANVEAEDGLGVIFKFIVDQFIGHAYLITIKCLHFF